MLAALLLVILVPVQAGAAACALICEAHSDAKPAPHASSDVPHEHHCDTHDTAGKCCHGYTVMIHPSVLAPVVPGPAFECALFVVRWTNFILEKPSPPPIVSAA